MLVVIVTLVLLVKGEKVGLYFFRGDEFNGGEGGEKRGVVKMVVG